ncbi:MAG: 3-phosphoserine/phosphohydroxythreonine transaminase [Rhodospirillales bacterium]|nr:3-phosphoserine/phosphohydroxythreonine transaminase [Rhodospirillales bacterium]
MTIYNFAAGPASLPPEILRQAQEELLDWRGTGLSVMEMPFTSAPFKQIMEEAVSSLRDLLNIPWNYHVLLMQGGAYGQFSIVPMNLLRGKKSADYLVSGHWSRRAADEAKKYCKTNIVAEAKANNLEALRDESSWKKNPDAAYFHLTTNETADGVQLQNLPDTGDVPIIADVTSDFLTAPLGVSKFGALYASAQKNVAPSGLTIVIIREDLLNGAMPITPTVFNYQRLAENTSKVNTLPTWSIYMAGLMFQWVMKEGGLSVMGERSQKKAEMLYSVIDEHDFYTCPVDQDFRSQTNTCFILPTKRLEKEFLTKAEEKGLVNLRGHGAIGGIRASLYNGVSLEAVETLADFMISFAKAKHKPKTSSKLEAAV